MFQGKNVKGTFSPFMQKHKITQHSKAQENLETIREILNQFTSDCKDNYTVDEFCTIDEMVEPFHGRCKFRQSIPSKPAKNGIKVHSFVDARTFYASNIEVY